MIEGCFDKKQELTGLEGKPMPSFNLLLLDSVTILNTNNILTNNRPAVLIFISPGCPYCKAQTEEIVKNIKSFKNIHLYFITNFSLESLNQYNEEYQLGKYSNITLAHDYESYFPNYFNVNIIPYIAIYTRNKVLKQVLKGKVSATLIKDIALN